MDARLQVRIQRYGWDRAATYYEDSWSRQLAPAQDRLLNMIRLREGEAVLDIACGTGLVTFRAAEAVGPSGYVAGVDLSGGMVETARLQALQSGLRNVDVQRMDAEDLQFPGGSFDVALCALGMMYVPDPARGMDGIRRVLKPGGRAGVAVWGQRSRCGWAGIFEVVDRRVHTEVCPMFFQLGTGDALRMLFLNAGFVDVRVERLRTVLRYRSGEEACQAAFAGGPVAMAYSRFDEKTRAEAQQDYLESIADYREEHGYAIPGEFVVAAGIRPAAV
jgi:ubiquinone/menaquinone biosynthesis C-methylase UbiE